MIEIYTPKEWDAFFGGSPSLIVDDNGYIYKASEYHNLMPRPCGWIDLSHGEVYGEDYGSINPRPIAYIRDKDGIKEVYEKRPEASWGAVPFLYIANGRVYTREEYYKVFGGSASAYVKDDTNLKAKEEPKQQNTNSTVNSQQKTYNGGRIPAPSGGGGGSGSGCGCFLFIVAFLALGLIFDNMVDIISDPKRLFTFCLIYIGLVLYGILLAKLFFGVASLIKGEGFMKGFNTKIIKELKEKFVWSRKKSKPKTTTQTQNGSNSSAKAGPAMYQHTCVKCGKRFSDQTAHNPYCESCRTQAERATQHAGQYATNAQTQQKAAPQKPKQAMQTCKVCGKKFPAYVNKSTGICMECTAKAQASQPKNPVSYTHHCLRCGKAYPSTLKDPENKYCNACNQLMQQEKAAAEEVKKPKVSVYAHRCPVCGKAYTSAEKEPLDLRCGSCKTASAAKPVSPEEKKIFTCPKCGVQNRVPAGKGKIVITCRNQECRNRFIVGS